MAFFTEIWFNNEVTDSMFDQHGRYQIFRCDRPDRVGGGVCAMIEKGIKCTRLTLSDTDQSLLLSSKCELICLDVFISDSKCRIILTYRPPNIPDSTQAAIALCDLLYNLSKTNVTSIILGDFNLPLIDWANNYTKSDGVHDILYDCFLNLGLT